MFGNWQVHVAFEIWGILFCLMAAAIESIAAEKKKTEKQWLMALFLTQALELMLDSLAWFFRGNTSLAGYYMVRISNAGAFVFNYLLLFVSTGYLSACFSKKRAQKTQLVIAGVIAGIGCALVLLTQFYPILYRFDAGNHYMRSDGFILSHIVGFLGMVLELVILTKNRRNIRNSKLVVLYLYLLMPLLAMVWQLSFYGISLLQIMDTISLMCLFTIDAFEQTTELVQKERQISDMKIQMVLSQIKPHFMYNILNTITYLCDKDAKTAKQALYDFSGYLRGNLDTLTSNRLIPLDRELDLVARYLALEKLRMEDELNIVYDISDNGYMLPPMTMEAFVENAVSHGLEKADAGGTLTIRTRLADEAHEIVIADDGVGFDVDHPESSGHKSVGIENVRKRLESMCGGTVTIHSIPGKGTTVRIHIPLGGEASASIS